MFKFEKLLPGQFNEFSIINHSITMHCTLPETENTFFRKKKTKHESKSQQSWNI